MRPYDHTTRLDSRPRHAAAWAVLCLGLAIFLVATPAAADAFQSIANQRNMLPGGRAALLGGAFTAVADDTSAGYYNPAGLALLTKDRIQISSTAYRHSELTFEEAVNDEPFDEESEVRYPSFVGGSARLGWLSLGYSFLTLEAHNIYQQHRYADISTAEGDVRTYSRTYQETSAHFLAGGSLAARLTDSLSVGTSAFYYQRNIEFSTNELLQLNGGGLVSINNTLKTLNTGVANVSGVLWRRPSYSVGAAVRTAMSTSDRSTMMTDRIAYDPEAPATNADGEPVPTVTSTKQTAYALHELNPATYLVGVAWHPSPHFLVSSDVLVHEGVKSTYKHRGGADLHTTINYSLGLAVTLGSVEILGGYFTNNSMYRPPNPERVRQPVYIDYTGFSAGGGLRLDGFQGYLGMVRQTGHGEAQILNDDPTIQKVDGNMTTYLISGTVPL